MTDERRCCGSAAGIVDAGGRCWCGQQWTGTAMCSAITGSASDLTHPIDGDARPDAGSHGRRAFDHRISRKLDGDGHDSAAHDPQKPLLDAAAVSRVIEMAWEDRTPFEAIHSQFALDEGAVIALMRKNLKPGSFRLWRERVRGRTTKHAALRPASMSEPRHQARPRSTRLAFPR